MRSEWLLLLTMACAPLRPVVAAPQALGQLSLEAETSSPYEVTGVVATVDGQVVARSLGTATLQLSAGRHEVAVAMALSRPCELGAESRQVVRVRAAESFWVERAQPHIVAKAFADVVNAPDLEATLNGEPFSAVVTDPGCCSADLGGDTLDVSPEPTDLDKASRCTGRGTQSVLIRGEVLKPQEVVWHSGLTAKEAIDRAGGGTRLANLAFTEVRRHCGDRWVAFTVPWHVSTSTVLLKPGDDVILRMTPEP